jgi:hypothetical protein
MRSLVRGIKHLLAAVLLLAGVVCAAEVGLRGYTWYQQNYQPAAAASDLGYVIPSSETYQQLRPLASSSIDSAHGAVQLRTNSFGLRGPEPLLPKPAGTFRVLCLGDERTIAADVAEEDSYCTRLQTRLQTHTNLRIEVVNAGLPNGCPLTQSLLLSHRLIGLQPDVVLVHVDATDVADDRLIRPYTFVDDEGRPVAAIHPNLRAARPSPLLSLSQEFRLVDLARQQLAHRWESSTAAADVSWNETEWSIHADQALSPLIELKRLAGSAYCELVVSTIGDPLERRADRVATDDGVQAVSLESSTPTPALMAFAAQHNLLYVDAASYLPDSAGGGRIQALTPEQHDAYAAVLTAFVIQSVPGVWTEPATTQEPALLPALPGVARTPRE